MHLSDFMEAKRLGDEDVAAQVGRSRVTISRIRRRKVRPDWETIELLRQWSEGQISADDFASLQVAE